MNEPAPPPIPEPIFSEAASGRTEEAGQSIDEGEGRIFPCEGCGADLKFHIDQQQMVCPYCNFVKKLEWSEEEEIVEQDFEAMLLKLAEWRDEKKEEEPTADDDEPSQEIKCESCSATVVFVGALTSSACPYCSSPLQREKGHKAEKRIPVDGILPFLVTRPKANGHLKEWVNSRWFAPNAFRKKGVKGDFEGVYLPYWTFDSMTFTKYTGQRGEHYYVTSGSGKNKTTVRKTRWWPASGSFHRFFDDVLVLAAKKMNLKLVKNLEPWPLSKCVPFKQELLAGLFARTYEVELDRGFTEARKLIKESLTSDVCSRIGGDDQRISTMKTAHDAIMFKHLLLPVWLMSYKYNGTLYQVMVNAATGQVYGERPYSWVKITFAVLAGLAIAGVIALLTSK